MTISVGEAQTFALKRIDAGIAGEPRGIHIPTDPVKLQLCVKMVVQQFHCIAWVGFRGKPFVIDGGIQYHRHAVVKLGDWSFCGARDDRAARDAQRVVMRPEACEGKGCTARKVDKPRVLCLALRIFRRDRPFIEAIRWDQATFRLEGVLEGT